MHSQFASVILEPIHSLRRRAVSTQLLIIAAALLLNASSAHAAASTNLSIRVTATTFFVGSPGTYHVSVKNTGPSTTDDVVTVSDTLPPGLSFASSRGAWSCTANGATVSCTNTSPLIVGSSTFELIVNVGDAAVPRVTNQFRLSYAGDTTPTNNTTTRTTSVRLPRFPTASPTITPPPGTPPPTPTPPSGTPLPTHTIAPTATATATQTPVPAVTDLKLTKTMSGTFTVGSNGTYILTVTNVGPNATNTGITVVDNLPTGLGFVSAIGSGWGCSAAGSTVTCTMDLAVAPGASTSITLTVSIAAAAAPAVTNTASLSYPGDTNATNNTANRPTTVRGG